jgi:hypothetical protein
VRREEILSRNAKARDSPSPPAQPSKKQKGLEKLYDFFAAFPALELVLFSGWYDFAAVRWPTLGGRGLAR